LDWIGCELLNSVSEAAEEFRQRDHVSTRNASTLGGASTSTSLSVESELFAYKMLRTSKCCCFTEVLTRAVQRQYSPQLRQFCQLNTV